MRNDVRLALGSWRAWEADLVAPPQIQALLKGGLTNRSYLAHSPSKKFVIRLNNPRSSQLGINRETEANILARLGPLGISQNLIYACPTHSFTVLEYIDGRVWQGLDVKRADNRRALLQLIERYRDIEIDIPHFNYVQYVNNYWRVFKRKKPVEARGKATAWKNFNRRLKFYQKNRKSQGLVHHDVVAKNIIETADGLRLIDWEYAGKGFTELDLNMVDQNQYRKKNQTSPNVRSAKNEFTQEIMYWLDFLWWKVR